MGMLDRALDYIQKNWKVVKKFPLVSAAVLLVGFSAGLGLTVLYYSERIEVLEKRIDDYKERLGLVPPDQTAYSKLTNEELKREALNFVGALRNFHRESEAAKPNYIQQQLEELRAAKTDEDKKEIQQRYFGLEIQAHEVWASERDQKYDKHFKAKAVILKDEMSKRLPQDKAQPSALDASYIYLLGPSPIERVAGDLERLSQLVP
jgi:hypothetical protein